MKTWEIQNAQVNITPLAVENSATRIVPKNSVLVVVRSGVLKHTLPVAITRVPVAINQDMKALVCGTEISADYLAHFIKARSGTILQWVRATTADNFPVEKLKQLDVPLPHINEQRRIAEVLDRAEALRAKRRAALAQLDTLTQGIFAESFVYSPKIPSATLETVCSLITDGTHYTPTYSDSGVIFLSSRNVTTGYIDWHSVKYIPEELHVKLQRRVAPRRNDVLLAKNGTTGVAALVDRDCVFDIYVSLALLRASAPVLPIFLREAINSPLCKRQFNSSLKGIGVPNLHLIDIRKTRIPVPPIAMQEEFVSRVVAIEKLRQKLTASDRQLSGLFDSLQAAAFSGRI
jgi:type I restriction enzyme S subunit